MTLPFFNQLRDSRCILIAGAGGGFDVFAGLPLFLWLRQQGKTVHLANLSFSDLSHADRDRQSPDLIAVQPDSEGSDRYFPERYLAQWLEALGISQPIYAIERGGAQTVASAYEWLNSRLQPDTLILIDGGTDIVMRGDEAGLGTPEEDIASLAAAYALRGPTHKFVVCLGFGADTYHGVCHAHFLENVAALSVTGSYLGSWSLLWEMPEVRRYAEALQFATERMSNRSSIVNSSIISALQGHSGNHHASDRTHGSELFISPLMSQYWAFDLPGVAQRNLYLDQISTTQSYPELTSSIASFRGGLTKQRRWTEIPY